MEQLTIEKFEEAYNIVRQAAAETKLVCIQRLFLRADRKQGLSEARKYAGDRRVQDPWCLL